MPRFTSRGAGVRTASGPLWLEAVTKAFRQVVAVDAVDLTIEKGTFFALLGPSGCGKSTTLRMVAGLEQPTTGRVWLGQTDLTGTRPYERPVNTVFQSYALFPHLDVLENVAFGPRRRRLPDAVARAESALERVQLADVARRRPGELSGGQQQRVALARALVNEPEVLLLDEPLGSLDLKLRRQMQVELRRIHRRLGGTFVHVTHDQDEAMTMADQVALMEAGRIAQVGAPAELYDLPRSVFAANFLGRSNLVRGRVRAADEGVYLVEAGGFTLAVARDRCVTPGPGVTLGVRPEKVVICAEAPQTSQNWVGPGRVSDVSFTGVSTEYLVGLPGLGTWSVFAQNVSDSARARPGDAVYLAWDSAHTFGLDPDEALDAGIETDLAPGEPADGVPAQVRA